VPLIEGINAEHLFGDRAYDTNAIIEYAEKQNINLVIPSKKNRTIKRNLDKDLYRLRHLVENAFLHIKRWRGIATRYAKNSSSFLAAVHIRCIAIWCRFS
jgi:transposase